MSRTSHRVLPLVLALAVSALAASAAQANGILDTVTTSLIGGNCGATQAVFAPWGDTHQYYPTPNGGFESGNAGWALSGGAQVVAGNEPSYVHGQADSHSLLLPSGASATSAPICFGLLNPGVRFFATSTSGPATIHVRVIATGLLGILGVLDGGTATVGTSWAPTSIFSTTFSQLSVPLGTKTIQLQFTSTGNVQIDDIYIDPFVSH